MDGANLTAPFRLDRSERHHWTLITDDLTIIGVNTARPGRVDGALDDADLAWLDAALGAARTPILVAFHHPPISLGAPWIDDGGFDQSGTVEAVIARHQVAGVWCGHVHRRFTAAWAATVLVSAPSSAYQLDPTLDPAEPRLTDLHPDAGLARVVDGRLIMWNSDAITPRHTVGLADALGAMSSDGRG